MNYRNYLVLLSIFFLLMPAHAVLALDLAIPQEQVRITPLNANAIDITKNVELERLARQLTEDLAFSLNYYTTKRNLRTQVEKSLGKLLDALTRYVTTIYHERKYDLARTNFYYIRSKFLLLKKSIDNAFEDLDLEMINKAIIYDSEERTLKQKEELIMFEKKKAKRLIDALTQAVNQFTKQVKNLPIP